MAKPCLTSRGNIAMPDIAVSPSNDQSAIRAVLDEYCLRLEVDEFDEWMDLFTEDTVYEVYRLILRGRQEGADLLSKAPHGVHLPGATRVTIDGDRAETVQNYLFVSTTTN